MSNLGMDTFTELIFTYHILHIDTRFCWFFLLVNGHLDARGHCTSPATIDGQCCFSTKVNFRVFCCLHSPMKETIKFDPN